MKFLQTYLASFLAVLTAFIIGIPILLMVLAGALAAIGSSEEKVSVPSGTILHLKLNQTLVENESDDPLGLDLPGLLAGGSATRPLGIYQLLASLDKAGKDDRIKGIYLEMPGFVNTGWANLKSIREALLAFKASGKFIYAYSEVYSEPSYYLASAADSVFMPVTGMLELNGLAATPMFYTGLFEKLGIEPKVFKVGTFKSAVEPFLRKDMSPEAREQAAAYLGDIWDVFATDVAASRGLSRTRMDELASTFILGNGKAAVAARLADRVVYEQDVLDRLAVATGKDPGQTPSLMEVRKYAKAPGTAPRATVNKVVVIFAEGGIQSGKSGSDVVGSKTVTEALRRARQDKNVKAVVLRINSPGGSALASDMIMDEVRRTREIKPVIASMADVAASGGYYIAAMADKIFAQENTITGSIGIFSILFEVESLLGDKLGLNVDEVETHPFANIANPAFPMSPAEEAFFQQNVQQGYSTFISVVQAGRKFPDSVAVDKIAQGRVWSGRQAQQIGLVDEIGDLQDAITYAAAQAGIAEDYRVEREPRAQGVLEEIMTQMNEKAARQTLDQWGLGAEAETLRQIRRHIPASGTYMLMPYMPVVR
ncbi:MAG: signal peptide peptidase SppA [Bacteroidia bacterium]|nr:signal peptide peptidase SppA [Bacteroidia bacterium]